MPTIEIDDEVFAKLQGRARAFVDTPNDVIKRLLVEVETGSSGTSAPPVPATGGTQGGSPTGRLLKLVQQGLVRPGDRVTHQRKRANEVFEATITESGCLRVEGVPAPFREPSPALRHFTGSQIDGWHNWTHVKSGRTLRELRDHGGH